MDVSACQRSLDKAALLISQGRYPVAIGLLSQIENDVKTAKSALAVEMMRLRESDMKIQESENPVVTVPKKPSLFLCQKSWFPNYK